MEKLVSIYNQVIDFDQKMKSLNVVVYRNKEDLVKKYVYKHKMDMKIDEPITKETYDDNFKKYLTEVNMLIREFDEHEPIIVGTYGNYVERMMIGINDVRLYRRDELNLLAEDIEQYYSTD